MKIHGKIASLVLPVAAVFLLTLTAYAATPALSLVNTGGDSVQISVTGDPNAAVIFYYNVGSASGMQTTTLGTTNPSGSFSTTINASTYGINVGNSVYVIVNGQQSAMQTWPSATGTPSLSQNNITLGLGQSVTVFSQGSSAPVYMSSNSNPLVASAQTNGTQQIAVTATQTGSTTATICFVGTASNCANLNITVQSGSVLAFSQNNITLAVGQSTSVAVSGGNGSYSVTGNSNPSAVSAVLGGTTITVSASAIGNANVTVCDGAGNCGTVSVTAGNATASGSLSFSNSNPSIAVGQVVAVNISGGSGYYVTGNSNPNAASQSINGSTLTISGLANGTTTITVCSTSNGCGSISAAVGSTAVSQSVTFGVTNPTVAVGQNENISLSGGSGYFISSNPNTNIIQASVSGGTLTLYGVSAGSASLAVCVSSGGCNTLYVTVTNSSAPAQNSSNTSALLAAIQSMQSQLAQIVAQIQSMTNTLTQLASGMVVGNAQTSGSSASPYAFTQFLSAGSQGAEVSALQERLAHDGFYFGAATGYYGPLTEKAVKVYQSAQGLTPAGYVGPSTRAALNAGK